jgi:hypothetical protein
MCVLRGQRARPSCKLPCLAPHLRLSAQPTLAGSNLTHTNTCPTNPRVHTHVRLWAPAHTRLLTRPHYACDKVYEPGRGLAFHFDKDEHLLVSDGAMVNPVWSSVLYLTGSCDAGARREGGCFWWWPALGWQPWAGSWHELGRLAGDRRQPTGLPLVVLMSRVFALAGGLKEGCAGPFRLQSAAARQRPNRFIAPLPQATA